MSGGFATAYGVYLPSGAWQPVLTEDEASYLEQRVERYNEQLAFENVSDLETLSLLLGLELMTHRWRTWLGQRTDYDGDPIDELLYQRELNSYSTEIRQVKKLLAIDKASRDRQKGVGSIPHYWANLQERAKRFGVMRVRQLDRSLELTQQLLGLVDLHKNANTEERHELAVEAEDIVDWVDTVLRPEFNEIDEHFRTNDQRFWVRDQ